MRATLAVAATAALTSWLAGCGGDEASAPGSPHAIAVVDVTLGEGAGFGAELLPDVVLGPPRGGGLTAGSLDTLSLGLGGSIVIELGTDVVDAPGSDLLIFENAFRFGGAGIFSEPGAVAVSLDGRQWYEFACATESPELTGCAGRSPVFAHAEENSIDPTDPVLAGGDAFDLADVGVPRARFVRIIDSGVDRGFGTDNMGFDLDAVAVIHGD